MTTRPQVFRQVVQRGYASGGHESAKAGGDTLWAVGAIGVTVPTCWYLLSSSPDTAHGHGDHGDSHAESHDGEEAESKDEPEEKQEESDEKDGEKSEDSESEAEDKESDTPDTSDDEGGEETKKDGNIVKSIPDAKGPNKKRLESEKGIKQGETSTESGEGEPDDKAAASKPVGGKNSQSAKQEGLSNTDTKHSTNITDSPDHSTKGEGAPETAKVKGTVDPARPQV